MDFGEHFLVYVGNESVLDRIHLYYVPGKSEKDHMVASLSVLDRQHSIRNRSRFGVEQEFFDRSHVFPGYILDCYADQITSLG